MRQRIGETGELHIDRRLPFLCVYRHRKNVAGDDSGTRSLLNGQAAHLVASADTASYPLIVDLVALIAETQSAAFGSFLLVELWANDVATEVGSHLDAPTIRVHAQEEISNNFLESVEVALQAVSLRGRPAEVRSVFGEHCSPPGLGCLMAPAKMRDLNCIVIGLGVDPAYRDSESGALLPFALDTMRRSFSHALKTILYRFSHHHTRYRPAHYQELGPSAATNEVLEVDRQLAEISESFDLLLHVTPINAEDAWNQFKDGNFGKAPTFHYRPREIDPALLKRILFNVPVEQAMDPTFIDLFASKRDELDRQITLLSDRSTEKFLLGSLQIFGQVGDRLLNTANRLIARSDKTTKDYACKLFGPGELAEKAREEIERYRTADPSFAAEVELRDDVTGILVSHGNFLIGSDSHVADTRLHATLNHEVGTHAVTYHNGKRQPLQMLRVGLAGYEELQEGIAVLAEFLSGGLTLARLQLLAGRVIAVHNIAQGADFVESFRLLHEEFGFRAFTAYTMTMRVYRGGGYTKDMIYLRGLLSLLDYLAAERDLELLFYGKVAMEHLHLLEELRWRRVLHPIALMPHYLEDEDSRARLDALKRAPTLEHILGNVS